MSSDTAQLSIGMVMHARHQPLRTRFAYPIFTLLLPLSRLAEARLPLLGIDRWNLLSVMSRDHGARDGSPLEPWIRNLLARHDLACADGEIVLQTWPRLCGYVFNPVSFWYCHDRAGRLRAVLAEVNNTFGERHNYLVAHADRRPIEDRDELRAAKVFHVSPFFPARGEYRFRFSRRGAHLGVAIDYYENDVLQLSTRLTGRDAPLSTPRLLGALLRCPSLSVGVMWRIHWQALRLALRRVPFFSRPALPTTETTT